MHQEPSVAAAAHAAFAHADAPDLSANDLSRSQLASGPAAVASGSGGVAGTPADVNACNMSLMLSALLPARPPLMHGPIHHSRGSSAEAPGTAAAVAARAAAGSLPFHDPQGPRLSLSSNAAAIHRAVRPPLSPPLSPI